MNFDQLDSKPKLLISDALKDLLPEDQLGQVDDMFISVALMNESREICLVGNLVGIEFNEKRPKVDVKVTLRDAFNFIGNVSTKNNKKYDSLVMMLGDDVISVPGTFILFSVKIIEIDSSNKLCVLGIDLINNTP